MNSHTNDKEKYKNWPTIDPFQQSTQWLNDGLEVGINSAERDKSKIRKGITRKIIIFIYQSTSIFLSLVLRKKAKSKSKNPYQRPWLPIWPGLKAEPFHDNKPEWTKILERNYPEIKKELFNLIKKSESFDRAIYDGFKGKPWTTKYFYLFGKEVRETHLICPVTSNILKKIPHNLMHICFSCIPGNGALPPHVGPTNTSLVCHLGLENCEKTAIFSGSEIRIYEEGKTLILDDSFIHGVKNTDDKSRYTLMISFWHPELSKFEKIILNLLYKPLSLITK